MTLMQETAQDRSTEFVPVQGGGETTSAGALLIVAYGLMWAVLIGFILLTWRRQRRLEAKADELGRQLAEAAGARDRP